jgi:dTDP-4-amino-4,6-dideoxygalactose transaminase
VKRRAEFLPFFRPLISEAAIAEVVDTLRSGWLTRGPRTEQFEGRFAAYLGVPHAVAVNSATAALHLALVGLGVGAGDEVITSPITFPSTANVIVHAGGRPVFADVEPDTLNLDPASVAERIGPRTRAIIAVHLAGHPCDLGPIREAVERPGIPIIEDAAHAIEAEYGGRKVGALGRAAAFSFYATKNLTTGEGGMLTTADPGLAEGTRLLALHGISRDAWKRYAADGEPAWEARLAGFKYNMGDIQAALGLHQLEELEASWRRRRALLQRYRERLRAVRGVRPLAERPGVRHACHLCIVRLDLAGLRLSRRGVIEGLRARNVGSGIHFPALHLEPYYRQTFGFAPGDCPVAEAAGREVLSLPLFPAMTEADVDDAVEALADVLATGR